MPYLIDFISLGLTLCHTGCVINDAWTLAYLRSYMNDTEILLHGAKMLIDNPHWNAVSLDAAYIESQCMDTTNSAYPRSCGNSFVPVVVSQLPEVEWRKTAEKRASLASRYLEEEYGTWTGDMFFYNASQDGMAFQVTANMALATAIKAYGPDLMWDMYGASAIARLSHQPYLADVPTETIHVQQAWFNKELSQLEFTLLPVDASQIPIEATVTVRGWVKAGYENVSRVLLNNTQLSKSTWLVVKQVARLDVTIATECAHYKIHFS